MKAAELKHPPDPTMPTTLEKRPDYDGKLIHAETNPVAGVTLTDDVVRQASDPTTPPDVLARLAAGPLQSVGRLIAANPNAPEEILHRLWLVHPLATLENPILAYRALATGKRFHEILPVEVKLALYEALRKECRDEDLERHLPENDRASWMAYSPRGDILRMLPAELSDSVCRHLAGDVSAKVRRGMLDRLPIEYLQLFSADPDCAIRIALAHKLPCGLYRYADRQANWDAISDSLCVDMDKGVRAIVAASNCLTASAHSTLADDPCSTVREILAGEGSGPDLPEAGWRKLVSGGDLMCRLVATNEACPESIRLDLTSHTETAVRAKAWEKLKFGTCQLADKLSGKLEILFSDPRLAAERRVIAANRGIPTSVIERLMRCEASVTRVLATNTRLKEDDRALLLQQDDLETAVIAVQHSSSATVLNQGSRHGSPKVRAAVAGLTGQHAAKLRFKLAVDPSAEVREAVRRYLMGAIPSYNGCNISEALGILLRDPLAKIRAAVLSDHRLGSSRFKHLETDPSVRVRLEGLRLLGPCPRSHFGLLDHKSKGVRLKAAKLIMQSGSMHCGWRMKGCARFDAKIAADSSPVIRSVAAGSAFTSVKVLEKLIRDESTEVQDMLAGLTLPRSRSALAAWVGHGLPRALKRLEFNRNPYCRAVAASSRIAGKKRQSRMSSDRCWFVRLMLAKNGHELDEGILQKLSVDHHPLVRSEAENRIQSNQAEAGRLTKGGRP